MQKRTKIGNILPSFTQVSPCIRANRFSNVNKHFFNHTRLLLHLCLHCLSCRHTSIKFMECSCSYDNQGGHCGAPFHCFTLFQKPKLPPEQSISFHSDLSAHTVLCKWYSSRNVRIVAASSQRYNSELPCFLLECLAQETSLTFDKDCH